MQRVCSSFFTLSWTTLSSTALSVARDGQASFQEPQYNACWSRFKSLVCPCWRSHDTTYYYLTVPLWVSNRGHTANRKQRQAVVLWVFKDADRCMCVSPVLFDQFTHGAKPTAYLVWLRVFFTFSRAFSGAFVRAFFASAPIKSYKKSNLWVSSFYFLDFSRAFSGAFSRALYIYVRMCAHIETYGNIS